MTTRYNTITVTLEESVRADDIQAWINAIRLMEGVADAEPGTPDGIEFYAAKRQVRDDVLNEVSDVLDQ